MIARDAFTTPASVGAAAPSAARCACSHCGQDVPAGMIDRGALAEGGAQFCCDGCRAAWTVIHGCGLERYYALRASALDDASQGQLRAAREAGSYREFDDPTFHALYTQRLDEPAHEGEDWRSAELLLEGVHCSACVWLVEKLPTIVPGVRRCVLDLRRATVRVEWNAAQTLLSRVARTLHTLGYPPHPARGVQARDVQRRQDRAALVRIGIAGACTANIMLLYVALYAGMFEGIDRPIERFLTWSSLVLSTIAILGPGWVFFAGAWRAVRASTMHLDIPLALGLGGGLVWGVASTLLGRGEIYLDSISALVFFLLVGRFLQQRQGRLAADQLELLFTLTPTAARLVEPSGVRAVPTDALRPGDVVEVLPGACVPADGVVEHGSSSLDRAVLTGESRPAPVREGDMAHAGATNLSGVLRVRVTASGSATRIGKLMQLVEQGAASKAPLATLANRIAGVFLVVMMALAAITAAAWWPIDPYRGMDAAVALLVVTCPCGLGLATPLIMSIAMGRAARAGVLIKSADAVERLSAPPKQGGVVLIDKTGTLTLGRTRVVRWMGPAWARPLGAIAVAKSTHHAAIALIESLPAMGSDAAPHASEVHETTGAGVEALVTFDGQAHRLHVGKPAFVRAHAARTATQRGASPHDAERALTTDGLTPVLIAVDGVIVAAAGLGDAPRPDAARAIASLRARGWRVRMLSGDATAVAQRVAHQLGIDDVVGDCSPEDKLAHVRAAAAETTMPGTPARVVMIGDGVNDAPALAAADVGIAVHGGAEASLSAADLSLATPGVEGIVRVFDGCARTMRAMRVVIATSIAYNVLAAALCMSGHITALWAAIIMPASSLTVLAVALRARTFDGPAPAPGTRTNEPALSPTTPALRTAPRVDARIPPRTTLAGATP